MRFRRRRADTGPVPPLPPPVDSDAPTVAERNRRIMIGVAVAATVAAVPLLVIDNLPDSEDRGEAPPSTVGRVPVVDIPIGDRPTEGPRKGVSVVTSSTTSSTVPIILTTTTTQPLPPPRSESDGTTSTSTSSTTAAP